MSVSKLRPRSSFQVRVQALAFLMLGAAPAFSQAIDLSKPLGNSLGCTKKEQPGGEADDNFYLTDKGIFSANSSCIFAQTLSAPDGTLVITALCSVPGEDGRSINPISIVRSTSNPAALQVYDEYGELLEEVTPCP